MGISTQKVTVRGAKPSKGEMEGNAYDFTELYIEEHLDPQIAKGTATVPYKYGTSENYHRQLASLQFPLVCEADFMTVTNGRGGSKTIVTAIRPALKTN